MPGHDHDDEAEGNQQNAENQSRAFVLARNERSKEPCNDRYYGAANYIENKDRRVRRIRFFVERRLLESDLVRAKPIR
jgi:hypothetical protein